MPGRNYQNSLGIPYAYQGQEKDAETNLLNFELRQYDPRLGRWYNPDPMGQHHSPYLAMGNNPVSSIDPNGGWDVNGGVNIDPTHGADDEYANAMFNHGGSDQQSFDSWMNNMDRQERYAQDMHSYFDEISKYDKHNGQYGKWSVTSLGQRTFTPLKDQPIRPEVKSRIDDGGYMKAYGQGMKKSMLSNALFGVYPAGKPEEEYPDDERLQMAFAQGQLAGDMITMLASYVELSNGSTTIGGTSAALVAETESGIGVVITPETAVAGYGAGVIQVGAGAGHLRAATKHAAETQNWINSHKVKTGGSSGNASSATYKNPKSNLSGKEGAKDVPSWAKGEKPFSSENGKSFAKRLLDNKYGAGKYETGPASEFNKIKKWGDRAFE